MNNNTNEEALLLEEAVSESHTKKKQKIETGSISAWQSIVAIGSSLKDITINVYQDRMLSIVIGIVLVFSGVYAFIAIASSLHITPPIEEVIQNWNPNCRGLEAPNNELLIALSKPTGVEDSSIYTNFHNVLRSSSYDNQIKTWLDDTNKSQECDTKLNFLISLKIEKIGAANDKIFYAVIEPLQKKNNKYRIINDQISLKLSIVRDKECEKTAAGLQLGHLALQYLKIKGGLRVDTYVDETTASVNQLSQENCEAFDNNELGYARYKENNYNEALKNFELAIAKSEDYATAYENIATVYVRNGDYEKAICYYNKGLEVVKARKDESVEKEEIANPACHYNQKASQASKLFYQANYAPYYYGIGNAYYRWAKRLQLSSTSVNPQAFLTSPGFAQPHNGVSDKLKQASANLQKVSDKEREYVFARINLAVIDYEGGDYSLAEKSLNDEMLKLDYFERINIADQAELKYYVLLALGRLEFYQGKQEQKKWQVAKLHLVEAVSIVKQNPEIFKTISEEQPYYYLIVILEAQGDTKAACEHIKTYNEIVPLELKNLITEINSRYEDVAARNKKLKC